MADVDLQHHVPGVLAYYAQMPRGLPSQRWTIAKDAYFIIVSQTAKTTQENEEFITDMLEVVDALVNEQDFRTEIVEKWKDVFSLKRAREPDSDSDPIEDKGRALPPDSKRQRPDGPSLRDASSSVPLTWEQLAKPESKLSRLLATFEPLLRSAIKEESFFEIWQPSDVWDEADRERLRQLAIPRTPNSDSDCMLPDMLLHKLCTLPLDDRAFAQRFEEYSVNNASRFFGNAQGSGKTRMIFEILAHRWGLYINCEYDATTNPYGSRDYAALVDLVPTLRQGTDRFTQHPSMTMRGKQAEPRFAINNELAVHGVRLFMLSRYIVFSLFARLLDECGKTAVGPKLWLLLQIQPVLGPARDDIFLRVFQALLGLPSVDAATQVNELRGTVPDLQLIAFDEIQSMLHHLPDAFKSATEQKKLVTRSFAQPMLKQSRNALPPSARFLFAGTRLCLEDIEAQYLSVVLKEPSFVKVQDLGDHNSPEDVEIYLKQFISDDIWQSYPPDLIYKIGFWFNGRYRFASVLAQWILRLGPHAATVDNIIQNIIRCFTNLPLPNASIIRQMSIRPLIPEELRRDPKNQTLQAAQRAAMFIILTGRPYELKKLLAEIVEYGIGRFYRTTGDDLRVEVKESLVLLALTQCFVHGTGPRSFAWFLNDMIRTRQSSTNGYGYEYLMAFVFWKLFCGSGCILSSVVEFVGPTPAWANQRARLIDTLRQNIPPPGGNDHILSKDNFATGLGFEAENPEDVVQWITTNLGKPFLFPNKMLGPDIMFALLLDDGQVVFLTVQCKYGTKDLNNSGMRLAVFTTSPEHFWQSDKIRNSYEPQHAQLFDALRRFLPLRPAPPLPPQTMPASAPGSTAESNGKKLTKADLLPYETGPPELPILRIYANLGHPNDDPRTLKDNIGSYPLAIVPQSVYDRAIEEWSLDSFEFAYEHSYLGWHGPNSVHRPNPPIIAGLTTPRPPAPKKKVEKSTKGKMQDEETGEVSG
ncbi:hypothetical protein EXIGLDRAFT_726251 [Exidia glandulosa HHB12029]|uniref:Uncharacterized protein n=1 Tax=Exidia glandulosa HHB12029 TaxID=1314781 RepID=A0A165MFA1_EXIGL|nr:hypothetical protein EXIGLDRAFT_726251 [Exidia glandulosa HHB12029]